MADQIELLRRVSELIAQHLQRNQDTTIPVVKYHDEVSLAEIFDTSLPRQGSSTDDILGSIEQYLRFSVRTGHPQFFNQLWGGVNIPAVVGDWLSAATNTSMYTFEVAPVATLMENELIKKMTGLVGFEQGEGSFVTGGSNANMIALMAARNKVVDDAKERGLYCSKKITLFVSDQAHYSFLKAANILGIGVDNVVFVESDDEGKMIPQRLKDLIKQSKSEGNIPFFVAGTAGTTVLGAYDPLREIFEVAKKYDLWFHVDGSLGASALLSKRQRNLLDGVELADSVTWDAHKMMGIPLICSAILMKERGTLLRTCSVKTGDYLFHQDDEGRYDLGKMSLQCGRRVDALKLWLSWKYFGDEGYEHRIDNLFDLAQYAAQKVERVQELELVAPVQSVTVCFRYKPNNTRDQEDVDAFNVELRNRLAKSGKSIVNYATIEGSKAIRFAVMNPELTQNDIDNFFENIIEAGHSLEKRYAQAKEKY